MSVLLLGDDAHIDENKPFARMEIYVLLRSFAARDEHLSEMERFRAELPGDNAIQFLADPLSDKVPSYHAAMPYEVKKWVKSRQEVVDVRRFRNPNGFDESGNRNARYVPDMYSVTCRNLEQLEKHVEELKQFCAAREPPISPLSIHLTPFKGCSYLVTMPEDVLEWVKGRDEVICMGREGTVDLCDPTPEPDEPYAEEESRVVSDALEELVGLQFSKN